MVTNGTSGDVTIDNGSTNLYVQGTVDGDLVLTSTGTINDSGTLSVLSLADLTGSAITINDTFNAGTLTFGSAGTVSISEGSATELAGTSTAGIDWILIPLQRLLMELEQVWL